MIVCQPGRPLSPREVEVLSHIAKGRTQKDIGKVLRIKVPTVRRHTHNIRVKLDAQTTAHAAVLAMRKGLIE